MKYSPKYEKVKRYFDKGLWTKEMVHNAVIKGWITAEEYEMIVGEPYEEQENIMAKNISLLEGKKARNFSGTKN